MSQQDIVNMVHELGSYGLIAQQCPDAELLEAINEIGLDDDATMMVGYTRGENA